MKFFNSLVQKIDAHLTVAKEQINYLADLINRNIETKILYNNLLKKFTTLTEKHDKLVQMCEKMAPEKVQALENQLEKFKLISAENEMKKTSEKRKLQAKTDKNICLRYAFIHGN